MADTRDPEEAREGQLRTEHAYFERLFESAPEAIVMVDTSGRVLRVNGEFCRLFGHEREDVLGQMLDDVVAPRHLVDEARGATEKLLTGQKIAFESVRRRKDSTLLEVSVIGAPIVIDGREVACFAIYRDISAQKHAQVAYQTETAYLSQLFDSAHEAIVITDNQGGVLRVNREFSRLFGYSREEALGRTLDEMVAPQTLEGEARDATQRVAEGGRVGFETVRRTRDGRSIDVSVIGSPILVEGEQVAVYAIYRDITEQKQAEQALRREKAYLEQLYETAQDAIVMVGSDSRVLRANQPFCRLFGYSHEEVLGRAVDDLVASDDAITEARGVTARVNAGERIAFEATRRRKDGTAVRVSVVATPILLDGKHVASYGTYRPIDGK